MEYVTMIIASCAWGITNPVLKRNSEKYDITFWIMVTNLNILLPQLINLTGSVFFFYTLSKISIYVVLMLRNHDRGSGDEFIHVCFDGIDFYFDVW
jgi:hypothetical protein